MGKEHGFISEKAEKLLELPEKIAIVVGSILVALSGFAPALYPVGSELVLGGGASLGIQRGTIGSSRNN